jgi:hypothetical protein
VKVQTSNVSPFGYWVLEFSGFHEQARLTTPKMINEVKTRKTDSDRFGISGSLGRNVMGKQQRNILLGLLFYTYVAQARKFCS